MIKRYTVFGNPVAHSLSPEIHALFSDQVQRKIDYTKTQVDDDAFISAVKTFQQSGAQGCNVTVPFKGKAFEMCDTLKGGAELAEAVNTIKFSSDGTLTGFNTDGSGLVADITGNLEFGIEGAHIIIAGAGGATRGILQPLLEQRPSSITICNRTLEKAQKLASRFSEFGKVKAKTYTDSGDAPADIVINATSLGLQGAIPDLPASIVGSDTLVYDLTYSKGETEFVKWGKSADARLSVDGLGMLLEQAADAYFIWEGVRPKTRLILPKLSAR